MKPASQHSLEHLQQRIGITWQQISWLETAFTHSSFVNEQDGQCEDNERLEFLGDSVVGLIVSRYLFEQLPALREGDMARIKSAVVSEETLATAAATLELGSYIRMGKGETQSGGRSRPSTLADLFEALVAAIYLDRGLDVARRFTLDALAPFLASPALPARGRNAKSALQEFYQKKKKQIPTYRLIAETGPDHRPYFEVAVIVDGKELARGQGYSRKSAEQKAAFAALKQVERHD
ncbi:MAG: ribonuclease III [Spirochaetales bacterium]|nr:ribonuclease III [Spirochaetales bacterium]